MIEENKKWIFLFLLALIWGSSFILIKKSLIGLSPMQLGSLRIIITGFILFIAGFNSLKNLSKNAIKWIVMSGFLGTFFPAFLFAYAETEIDSAIASILNSIVPINTILFGFLAFNIISTKSTVQNDRWVIDPLFENCASYELVILNRWGQEVFKSSQSSIAFEGKNLNPKLKSISDKKSRSSYCCNSALIFSLYCGMLSIVSFFNTIMNSSPPTLEI